jgi:hypothetical protein
MRATLLIQVGIVAAAYGAIAAPAAIASAAESADVTIETLQAQGFNVKVNRFGSAPLNQCVVTDVRKPRERTQLVPVLGRDNGVVPVVVDRDITVTVNCSQR